MKRTIVVLAGLLILLALALSPGQPALLAALPAQKATATPAAEAESTPTPAPEAEAAATDESAAEPTMADLFIRLESLEATVAELYTAHVAAHATSYDQANRVNTLIYLLDSAGLHDLLVRLSEDEEILPGDSGQVAQVARLFATVDWPEELAAEAEALHETLSALAVALADDDLETATPLADQAHEEQHDFSHVAQEWLTETASHQMADAPGQANRVNTLIYLLDSAGLHDLSVRLSEDEEILPDDSGQVAQVARLFATVDWPEELAAEAEALHETLSALAVALADDDLETATPLADQAHEEQHDFSHVAQEWLPAGGTAGSEDVHQH